MIPYLSVDLGPGIRAGFTLRFGGDLSDLSDPGSTPWAGWNLGQHVLDNPDRVAAHRAQLTQDWQAPVVFARQQHTATVMQVHELPDVDLRYDDITLQGNDPADTQAPAVGVDALVTQRTDLALGVLAADCVPIVLADAARGMVAAVHAGRPGLLAGIVSETVHVMRAAGAIDIRAALGPAAGPCCYEVPTELAQQAASLVGPEVVARTRAGTVSINLRAGCARQLAAVGVNDIQLVGGCTIDDDRNFSYRRAAVTGRHAGVIRLCSDRKHSRRPPAIG